MCTSHVPTCPNSFPSEKENVFNENVGSIFEQDLTIEMGREMTNKIKFYSSIQTDTSGL